MDRERFAAAMAAAMGGATSFPPSIGQLGEKLVHATVKNYLQPDPAKQELRLGRYVVDILDGSAVTEVQTRNFSAMKKKLTALLPHHPITVACPMAATKWVSWVEPQTGEVTSRRRSPKKGAPIQLCYELARLGPLLCHPNLRLKILLIDMEEYRLLTGWSRDGKRGSTRHTRLPLELVAEVEVASPRDYQRFLPTGLPTPFTRGDLQKLARLSQNGAARALAVLRQVGAVEQVGKRGNWILYEVAALPEEPNPPQ